jgi:hypothetical protein
MKNLSVTFCLVIGMLFGSVSVGLSLPPCPQNGMASWHLCEGIFIENGDTFRGDFRNNQKNGFGKYTWNNGDMFLGDYKNDKKNGAGVYSYATGDIFKGTFLDGLAHGRGKYSYSDGSKFIGIYNNGKRTGLGKLIFHDSSKFEGQFLNGKLNGFGKAKFVNGDKYVGQWRDDKQLGHGVYTWENGDVYRGNWERGKLSGHGSFSYSNGSYFYGEFDNGAKIGWGLKLAPHGYAELCEHHPSELKNCLNSNIQESFPVVKDIFNAYSGDDRRGIQLQLKKAGFYHIQVDGIWGRDSLIAIMRYASDTFGNIKLNNPDFAKILLSSLTKIK